MLLATRQEALSIATGEIDLRLCTWCGHLANRAFDQGLADRAAAFEDSQAFSGTFRRYAEDLARRWVADARAQGGCLVEIGCGRGEFSRLLVGAGAARVVALDPTLRLDRVGDDSGGAVEWRAETFGPGSQLPADCRGVVMRHVLEHVADPVSLLTAVRTALTAGGGPPGRVLVEVPDTWRILHEGAFWDVYYEHCGYFTGDSLRALFERCGFRVESVDVVYGAQYVLITARVGDVPILEPSHEWVEGLERAATRFTEQVDGAVAHWRGIVGQEVRRGRDVVLWGSGSKPAGFLAHLAGISGISRVVDINPHKHGHFMPGTGQRIVGPGELVGSAPDLVVVMNPVYLEEIRLELRGLGIHPGIVAL
ncbi:class I SAM-dependent methyltransferase [Terrabacter aerolatus]|uniref:class I SAM-dependent methyltransferase n=1 Tax=Terrabacter aerolatus TaxID=422442 RepID=UPI00164A0368|nr:class I SAM-dependent methyltransferase [Terrabacter aerolatus]